MSRVRLLLAAAAVFYGIFIVRTLFRVDGAVYSVLFDDAMVSMRYARNFAEGHGLVWNAGGSRVQGYTNPAWTLAMAAVHAAIPPRLASLVMMLLGAGTLLAAAHATYRLSRLVLQSEASAAAAAALAAFGHALVFWALRGMEVGVLAWLIMTAALEAVLFANHGGGRHLALASAALGLALWTRSDALVPAVLISVYVLAVAPGRARTAAVLGAALCAGVAAPMVFGWWYYGSALPNTYYLKLGGVTLSDRLLRGTVSFATLAVRSLIAAFICAALAFTARRTAAQTAVLALLAAIVGGQCAYSVYVGGDAWEYFGFANRYIAIAFPALAVLTVAGAETLAHSRGRARAVAASFALAAVAQAALFFYLAAVNRGIDPAAFTAMSRRPAATIAIVALATAAAAAATAWGVRRRSVPSIAFSVWVLMSGVPTARWAASNGMQVPEDEIAARLGLALRAAVPPGGRIAVSRAGAIPYFSEREAIDLLGKSDRVIARMRPVIPEFVPGHNKWDLEYSIGGFRPDVACNLPRREGEIAYLEAQGYAAVGGTCFVRTDAPIRRAVLGAAVARLFPGDPIVTGAMR